MAIPYSIRHSCCAIFMLFVTASRCPVSYGEGEHLLLNKNEK